MDQTIIQASALIRGGARTDTHVVSLFDPATSSVTHIIHDGHGAAVIVDPVLDFDAASGRISHGSANRVLDQVRQLSLTVELILETHVHADHISAASWLREQLDCPIGIGARVAEVQGTFAKIFELADAGKGFDRLFEDGESFEIGRLSGLVLHVPGHTPADTAYVIGDLVVTGDTIFMPDFGTARADFPGGDAGALFRSARRLLSLPGETRLLHCHDYPPAGRPGPAWLSTVAQQRHGNVHVRDGVTEAQFVALRQARDAALPMPALMLPSVQMNLCAGQLPPPSPSGARFLKLPLNAF